MVETWRAIPGYEGEYEVSDHGRVRSIARRVRLVVHGKETTRSVPPRILRPGTMNKFGHVSVALGKYSSQCVHALVALAFIGPRPIGYDVAHRDGIGGNNNLDNIRYATRSDNNLDRAKLGRCIVPWSVVCELRSNSASASDIARKYNLSVAHACSIRNYKTRLYA